MKRRKKNELSADEKKKLWQSICSHKGAWVTNTGTLGSVCVLCGKAMMPPNPRIDGA